MKIIIQKNPTPPIQFQHRQHNVCSIHFSYLVHGTIFCFLPKHSNKHSFSLNLLDDIKQSNPLSRTSDTFLFDDYINARNISYNGHHFLYYLLRCLPTLILRKKKSFFYTKGCRRMADTNLSSVQYGNGRKAVGRRDYDFHLYFTLKINIKKGRRRRRRSKMGKANMRFYCAVYRFDFSNIIIRSFTLEKIILTICNDQTNDLYS